MKYLVLYLLIPKLNIIWVLALLHDRVMKMVTLVTTTSVVTKLYWGLM